jgi:hypothetical protein
MLIGPDAAGRRGYQRGALVGRGEGHIAGGSGTATGIQHHRAREPLRPMMGIQSATG